MSCSFPSDQDLRSYVETSLKDIDADERKKIQSLCDLFDGDVDTMRQVETWYTNNVSNADDTAFVNRTIESMKSESECSEDDPLQGCARRLLLRQRVNHIRNSGHQKAEMAEQPAGQETFQPPLVSRLSFLLKRKYCSPIAFGPRIAREPYVFSGIEIALDVLIHTSENDLPEEVNDYMLQAFPGGGVKVLDEEALKQFELNPERIWGLILAVEYWRKPGFWEGRT